MKIALVVVMLLAAGGILWWYYTPPEVPPIPEEVMQRPVMFYHYRNASDTKQMPADEAAELAKRVDDDGVELYEIPPGSGKFEWRYRKPGALADIVEP